MTDATAEVTDTYNYDAFGVLLQRSGSTENNYLYTGEQFDPNVGFYYLRARYYNPEIGRFTTVDPWKGSIYNPVSLHKYLYCSNDPVDYVDWSGEAWTLMHQAITFTIIGTLWSCITQIITTGTIDPFILLRDAVTSLIFSLAGFGIIGVTGKLIHIGCTVYTAVLFYLIYTAFYKVFRDWRSSLKE